MPEPSAVLLTFEAITRALAEVEVLYNPPWRNSFPTPGPDRGYWDLVYRRREIASRVEVGAPFWRRWRSADHTDIPHDPRAWIEQFLHHEFTLFCQDTEPPAREREQILHGLRHIHTGEPVSPTVCMRIRELLFWPGVLFAYVRAHAVFAQYLHDYKREWLVICNQYLRAARKLKESFFRTDPAFVVLPEHIAQVKDLLRAADTSHAHFEAWKRTLGLDKQMANQPSRQRLWTPLFAELVPLVRPFCRGPKHAYLQEPGTMPDQAYAVASRLMWLAHPTLWDDKPSRIKSRLQHLRDTHPIVETPLP